MTQSISYEIAKPEQNRSSEIADLINKVYAVAEKDFWKEGHLRTNPDQISKLVNQGKIMTAILDGELVGVVQVRIFDDNIGWFGMLATAPEHRGKGIGRGLMNNAEEFVKDHGCTTMQCEVLVPEVGEIEEKLILSEWYSRLGYRHISSANFEKLYPHAVPDLKMDCKLDLFLKEL